MKDTATDENGIVHEVDAGGVTICGRNAASWSRGSVIGLPAQAAIAAGLALGCEECGIAA